MSVCIVDWCWKPKGSGSSGYCHMHRERKRLGIPMDMPPVFPLAGETPEEKLRLNYIVDGTCWRWQGAKNHKGYGHLRVNRVTKMAHRLSYEYAKGPIPAGLEIDHLCNVRDCVNPDHLEAVTHGENLRRIAERNPRTHCSRDHELTPDNTFVNSRGRRECRTCRSANQKAYRESRKKVA